jgi:cytochrome c553
MSLLAGLALVAGLLVSLFVTTPVEAQDARKPPETVSFAAKLGTVTFNHANHITKNYNIGGTGPIACVECHHVEQPAAEVAKHPPLKTAWPADRTATLTAETLKDEKTPAVVGCRSCHAAAGEKPKVLPELPTIKAENSTAIITLTNKEAFHRMCAGCHDQVVKTRQAAAPTSQKCMVCHKK